MNFRVKSAALVAATALFTQSSFSEGLYLTGGLMAGDIESENTSLSLKVPTSLIMVGVGKRISDTVDVEGRVFMTGGKSSKSFEVSGTQAKVQYEVPASVLVAVKPKLDMSKEINLYGLLGLSNGSIKTKTTVSGNTTTDSSDAAFRAAYGVGMEYNMNDDTFLNAEYLSLIQTDIEQTDLSYKGFNITVGKRF